MTDSEEKELVILVDELIEEINRTLRICRGKLTDEDVRLLVARGQMKQ